MPKNLHDINQWPRILLDRMCALWGEETVSKRLSDPTYTQHFDRHRFEVLGHWGSLGMDLKSYAIGFH